ncbi:MAG: gamma-glutamyltransferase [Paracoccus sp. (in: a-proteobacteria)]|nr:gamma-glutamyltransferase [Paracoccus sp. (in: a-proteobacteria)]
MTGFDFLSGRRPSTYAGRAMVATSHPLATAAGLGVLAKGGNAVDAAISASAVQAVVDPLMTGIGGDCFALYAPKGGKVMALNGSGRAPAAATIDALKAAGLGDSIPQTSPHAVTVPGAIAAWCRLHADCGSLPLADLFAAAIDYARNGYPVTPRVAQDWAEAAGMIATLALRPDTRTRSGSDFANSTSMRWPAIRFVGYRTPRCGL